jgi:hypothetical protein
MSTNLQDMSPATAPEAPFTSCILELEQSHQVQINQSINPGLSSLIDWLF